MDKAIAGPRVAVHQAQVEVIGGMGDAPNSSSVVAVNCHKKLSEYWHCVYSAGLKRGVNLRNGNPKRESAVTTLKHDDSNGSGNCEFV